MSGDIFTEPFLIHYRPAMPFGNRKKIEDLFSSVLSLFQKKITPLET